LSFVPSFEPIMTPGWCIFCLRHRSDPTPHCPNNPGQGCTYGLGHEYGPSLDDKPKQVARVDKKLCTKCGLHQKNPASASSDCAHEYPQ
jgi:hypothetical protein